MDLVMFQAIDEIVYGVPFATLYSQNHYLNSLDYGVPFATKRHRTYPVHSKAGYPLILKAILVWKDCFKNLLIGARRSDKIKAL